MRIEAAVVEKPGAPFEIVEVELDDPQPDEVLVRVVATGICATDVHAQHQHLPIPLPMVLGHEGAGVVERVGSAVTNLVAGDHVVLSYQSCGRCIACLTGHPAYCARAVDANFAGRRLDGSAGLHRATGDADLHGHFFGQSSFATHALATERNAVKVPSDLPLELLAPLGCGLQTGASTVLKSLQVGPGDSVAVFGAGAVGLAAVMAAHAVRARPIIAVDIVASRLELALELGATHVINSREEDVPARLRDLAGGGLGRIVDTTGRPEMASHAAQSLAAMGRAALIGTAAPGTLIELDPAAIFTGGSVQGAVQGDAVPHKFIPTLVELYRSGDFPIDRLVRSYDFSDINQAAADSTNGSTVKPVLRIGTQS